MITIKCPKCDAKLRVDPAFQGLTCRCTHCQSLLAIPSDAARMPVKLAPEPAGGTKSATGAGRSRSGSGTRSGTRAASAAAASRSGTQLQDVYSGSGAAAPPLGVVQPPRQAAATESLISLEPGRGRGRSGGRGGNQTAIIAGAVGVGAALLAIGVLLVVLIASSSGSGAASTAYASPQPQARATAEPESIFTETRATPAAPSRPAETDNPATWKTPTILGQPFAGHTVLLVDSVEQSRDWIDDVNRSLLETLTKSGNGERISVFYIHDGQVDGLPSQPLSPGRAISTPLSRLQDKAPASGRRGFYDGLAAAIDAQADHIVVVTGRQEWDKAGPYIQSRLDEAAGKPSFSIIALSGRDRDLQKIADATGGYLEPLEASTIRRW